MSATAKTIPTLQRQPAVIWWCAICLGWSAFWLIWPPVLRMVSASGPELFFWRHWLLPFFRPHFVVGSLILSGTAYGWLWRRRRARQRNAPGGWAETGLALTGWLPLTSIGMLLADRLPAYVVTMLLLLTPALGGALLMSNWPPRETPFPAPKKARLGFILFGLSLIGYTLAGLYLTEHAGEHLGDEGHYLIQAESLYEDGDLDIKNNIHAKTSDQIMRSHWARGHFHIAQNSREPHWYSFHPYGLPLVLAPFWPLGVPVRYLILALFGALANLAMYASARRIGVSRQASFATILAIGGSIFWVIYSSRAIPEMMGAALFGWTLWSVLALSHSPWRTLFTVACCGVVMLFTHERFIPLSLLAMGVFWFTDMLRKQSWKQRCGRSVLLAALYLTGCAVFMIMQYRLFYGGKKVDMDFRNVLFSYPIGLWGAIACYRGILSSFPLYTVLLIAPLFFLFRKPFTLTALGAITAVSGTFILTSSSSVYTGGACLPGRYLLVTVPWLAPFAAYVLDRTDRLGRWWFWLLACISILLLAFTFLSMEDVSRGYARPQQILAALYPQFSGSLNPLASFQPGVDPQGRVITTLFILAVFLTTLCLTGVPAWRRWIRVLPLGLTAALGVLLLQQNTPFQYNAWRLFRYLSWQNREVSHLVFAVPEETTDWWSLAARTAPLNITNEAPMVIMANTLHPAASGTQNDLTYASRISDGAMASWTLLTEPFLPPQNHLLLNIEGMFHGPGQVELAIRTGRRWIYEGLLTGTDGPVQEVLSFNCSPRKGTLKIFCRVVNGTGRFDLHRLQYAPGGQAVLRTPELQLSRVRMLDAVPLLPER